MVLRHQRNQGEAKKSMRPQPFGLWAMQRKLKKTYEVIAYAVETELGQGMGNDLSRVILEEVKRTQ